MVEGVDRQASSFISVFQCYDGSVQWVGQVTETRATGFNYFLGTLQRVREEEGQKIKTQDLQSDNHRQTDRRR